MRRARSRQGIHWTLYAAALAVCGVGWLVLYSASGQDLPVTRPYWLPLSGHSEGRFPVAYAKLLVIQSAAKNARCQTMFTCADRVHELKQPSRFSAG